MSIVISTIFFYKLCTVACFGRNFIVAWGVVMGYETILDHDMAIIITLRAWLYL